MPSRVRVRVAPRDHHVLAARERRANVSSTMCGRYNAALVPETTLTTTVTYRAKTGERSDPPNPIARSGTTRPACRTRRPPRCVFELPAPRRLDGACLVALEAAHLWAPPMMMMAMTVPAERGLSVFQAVSVAGDGYFADGAGQQYVRNPPNEINQRDVNLPAATRSAVVLFSPRRVHG